ncbi:hypothetical protein C7B62_02785 [Pleurocapsa sp. CCALA 161]|uniref:hypothetical protein n=1 Tax=Pleurocapsa sp. CCALA 161 TaxID=2107688 RepID=UPI000D055576|nr:hypothetical protein [Pleurocapsa sp. CCALA 161]PSB12182.1 hypothetical protein C7B62_02785 [Pleurocapsa sp. CCALA 161]
MAQKLTLQDYRNQIKLFKIKLALKTPQNFAPIALSNIAKVMTVDLKIISKLPGINCDREAYPEGLHSNGCNRFDWYLVEAFGTFDDLSLTIACWQDLGVKKYLAISSQ